MISSTFCPVCSRTVVATGKAGRPAEHCSKACADFNRNLRNLEESFRQVVDGIKADPALSYGVEEQARKSLSDIRGRLFVMANETNRVGLPVRGSNSSRRTKERGGWSGLHRTDRKA